MIGIAGATDIVYGYEVTAWASLSKEQQDALKPVETQVKTFLSKVAAQILAHKITLRARKQALENEKNQNYADLGESPKFASYLMKDAGYVAQLRQLGMSVYEVKSQYDSAGLKELRTAVTVFNGNNILTPIGLTGDPGPIPSRTDMAKELVLKSPGKKVGWTTVPGPAVPLIKLITDAKDGYIPQAATHARTTYRKKLTAEDTDATEYVLDDDGVFTRRFAVMYKTQDFIDLLVPKGNKGEELTGKFTTYKKPGSFTQVQGFESGPLDGSPRLLNDDLTQKNAGETLDLREALHVHQELGSRDSARGVCLTSISLSQENARGDAWRTDPKVVKTMYSNSGERFQGKMLENQLVLVDFAQVPEGQQLLYNLYRPDAQAKAKAVGIAKLKPKGDRGDHADYELFFSKDHMLSSVTKNREIFLRVVRKEYVVNWASLTVTPPPVVVAAATGGGKKPVFVRH